MIAKSKGRVLKGGIPVRKSMKTSSGKSGSGSKSGKYAPYRFH
jgi:hypothetical protein